MQQRLREAKKEALVRSVGRANGKRSLWDRLFRRAPRRDSVAAGDMDFRDRGEDVWKALRF